MLLTKGRSLTTKWLTEILITVINELGFVRLVVDGIDELQSTEHGRLLKEHHAVTTMAGPSCKLLWALLVDQPIVGLKITQDME